MKYIGRQVLQSLGSTTSLLGQVSTWISHHEEVVFQGTWMLVAEWNDVPENGSTYEKVHNYVFYIEFASIYSITALLVLLN